MQRNTVRKEYGDFSATVKCILIAFVFIGVFLIEIILDIQ